MVGGQKATGQPQIIQTAQGGKAIPQGATIVKLVNAQGTPQTAKLVPAGAAVTKLVTAASPSMATTSAAGKPGGIITTSAAGSPKQTFVLNKAAGSPAGKQTVRCFSPHFG